MIVHGYLEGGSAGSAHSKPDGASGTRWSIRGGTESGVHYYYSTSALVVVLLLARVVLESRCRTCFGTYS